jgi:hypothetical protein
MTFYQFPRFQINITFFAATTNIINWQYFWSWIPLLVFGFSWIWLMVMVLLLFSRYNMQLWTWSQVQPNRNKHRSLSLTLTLTLTLTAVHSECTSISHWHKDQWTFQFQGLWKGSECIVSSRWTWRPHGSVFKTCTCPSWVSSLNCITV